MAIGLRLVGDRLLGTRQAVAVAINRHPDQVKQHCMPVACEIGTKFPLYDADEAHAVMRGRRRVTDQEWRKRRVAC